MIFRFRNNKKKEKRKIKKKNQLKLRNLYKMFQIKMFQMILKIVNKKVSCMRKLNR